MNDTEPAANPPSPFPLPTSRFAPLKPSLRHRFWTFPITRIVVYILVFVVIASVLSGLLRSVIHLLLHSRQQSSRYIGMFLGEGIAAVSAVAAFWVMVRFVDKRPWASAGFNQRELLPQLAAGFLLGAVLLSGGIAILADVGAYHFTGTEVSGLVLVPLLLFFMVAVFEEIFFRGYVFQTLEARWGSGVALVVTSVVFGLAHLANPVPGVTTFQRLTGPVFICLEAGLPLAGAYLLTRRWWLSIGIHWAWDYFEGPVFGCPDSGTHDPHTLLHARLTGPYFVTGGPFGPEAGLVLLVAGTTLGAVLLRAAMRRGHWKPRPEKG